jgi:hypothetical protein
MKVSIFMKEGLNSRTSKPAKGSLTAIFLYLLSACATNSGSNSGINSAAVELASSGPSHNFEVVQCTPKLCGSGASIVGLNPSDEDWMALGPDDEESALSMDEFQRVSDVEGSEAEEQMDLSRSGSNFLADAFRTETTSSVINAGLAGLFLGLGNFLGQNHQSLSIPPANIQGTNEAETAKILSKIRLAMESLRLSGNEGLEAAQSLRVTEAINAIRPLAGDDGWLNRGDLPRFLPVISNVIAKATDGGSDETTQGGSIGYAENVAEYAKKHAENYRRWVRTSDGLIGSLVSTRLEKRLAKNYGQHWAELRQASVGLQHAYNKLMDRHAVISFSLAPTGKLKYYDGAKVLDGSHIDHLAVALSGKTVAELMAISPASIGAGTLGILPSSPALAADDIELPDGLPVGDIAELLKHKKGNQNNEFPASLVFAISPNGKLVIKKGGQPR